MKTLNQLLIGFIALTAVATITVSCGEDDTMEECNAESYEGTWVGGYRLGGLIPLDNNDTLVITVNGNTATITSALAQSTFNAEYNETSGEMEIGMFTADEFLVGNDTMFDVTADDGKGVISSDCNTLFITLNDLSIQDGTVDLDIIGGYPVNNLDVTTQPNNPFKKE